MHFLGLSATVAIPLVDRTLGGSRVEAVALAIVGDTDHRCHVVAAEKALLLVQLVAIKVKEPHSPFGRHCEDIAVAALSIKYWVRPTLILPYQFGPFGFKAVNIGIVMLVSAEEVLAIPRKPN